jgi:hypothetical protein
MLRHIPVIPFPSMGEGEGGGEMADACARIRVSPPSPPSPSRGKGPRVLPPWAAHGFIGAFEALTQIAPPGFAGDDLTYEDWGLIEALSGIPHGTECGLGASHPVVVVGKPTMLRTTIYLDEETVLALRQLATLQKCSQTDVIRDALKRYFEQVQPEKKGALPGVGAYRSGRHDISEQAEELLRQAARRR